MLYFGVCAEGLFFKIPMNVYILRHMKNMGLKLRLLRPDRYNYVVARLSRDILITQLRSAKKSIVKETQD